MDPKWVTVIGLALDIIGVVILGYKAGLDLSQLDKLIR